MLAVPTCETTMRRLGEDLNGYEFDFPERALQDLRALYRSQVEPRLAPMFADIEQSGQCSFEADGHAFYAVAYGNELAWISNDNAKTYRMFRSCFGALGLAEAMKPLIPHDEKLVMYCGFFIVSHAISRPIWHVDYGPNANGYTLLAPLFPLEPEHGRLLYRQPGGDPRRYEYEVGKGIVIGDGFLHTTEPYARVETPRVLLSMTFGSDRVADWAALEPTVGRQSNFVVLPCGHVRGSCGCLPPAPAR